MFEAYTLRARLAPAALAAIPAITLIVGAAASVKNSASLIAIMLGGIGLVVCGLVRDAGRRVEPELWDSWGGPPTTARLRWRSASDASRLEELHALVAEATGRALPTHADEAHDPATADASYERAVAVLRDLTRSRDHFPLIFDELATYGFRRNCLGVRPIALAVAASAVVASAVLVWRASRYEYLIGGAAGLGALAWWSTCVNPAWVRQTAELYADRLLASPAVLIRD